MDGAIEGEILMRSKSADQIIHGCNGATLAH